MVILIGIEGAWGDANSPGSGYAGSFIQKLVAQWPDQAVARYLPGPGVVGNINAVAAIASRTAMNLKYSLQGPPPTGLILAGYSRGGAAAIVAAHLLDKHGISVDCLALFDAVDHDPTAETDTVSANVQLTIHGMRSSSSGSRPLWGNAGKLIPNTAMPFVLKMTHWGAGGVPLHKGLPAGAKLTDRVTEDTNPLHTRTTNVTWQEDLSASSILWSIIRAQVFATYAQCKQRRRAPVNGGGTPYTVVGGDSLSLIAGKFYNDVLLWPILYDANAPTIGTNPNLIVPNQRLVVPDIKRFSQSELAAARSRGRNWRAA